MAKKKIKYQISSLMLLAKLNDGSIVEVFTDKDEQTILLNLLHQMKETIRVSNTVENIDWEERFSLIYK